MANQEGPDQESITRLADQAMRHGLVLFIGAGINGNRMPQWRRLLEVLLDQALIYLVDRDAGLRSKDTRTRLREWFAKEHDVYACASMAKALLGDHYPDALRGVLYAEYDEDTFRKEWRKAAGVGETWGAPFRFLVEVARLCQLPEVRAVATFNFDDLLEQVLQDEKVFLLGDAPPRQIHHLVAGKNLPLAEKAALPQGPPLPVYHIHGIIETIRPITRPALSRTVFSRDEYLQTFTQAMDWETSTPLHLLRNYCSLWLGTSLADWNMLRLLQAAQRTSKSPTSAFCLESDASLRCDGLDAEGTRLARRLRRTLLEDAGATMISAGADFDSLPETLSAICAPFARSIHPPPDQRTKSTSEYEDERQYPQHRTLLIL